MRVVLALAAGITILGVSSAHADAIDDWCQQVKEPRNIVVCSDAKLRQLVAERQAAFDEAKARLDPDGRQRLLTDQNTWVKTYARQCGLGESVPDPIPPTMVECFRIAGEARVAYLRAYAASSAPAVPEPPITITVVRWWCAATGGFYPQTANCPMRAWRRRRTEIDCGHAVEPEDTERCREATAARAESRRQQAQQQTQDAARAAEAEAEHQRVVAEQRAAQAEAEARQRQAEAAVEQARIDAENRRKQEEEQRAEAKLKYEEEIAAQVKREKEKGYRPIDFADYALDKKSLAKDSSKVAIRGYYTHVAKADLLLRDTQTPPDNEDDVIPLLTEDADRDLRKYLVVCRESLEKICPVTVMAHGATCKFSNGYGVEHGGPCLDVDDGWNVAEPK